MSLDVVSCSSGMNWDSFMMSLGKGLKMSNIGVSTNTMGNLSMVRDIVMVNSLLNYVTFNLMRSLSGVMFYIVMRLFGERLLVMSDFVMLGELTGMTIVVVHLEDKGTILDIDLA